MGIRYESVPFGENHFKYPINGIMGLYAGPVVLRNQEALKNERWLYLSVGSQYLSQRWREVRLSADVARLHQGIMKTLSSGKPLPRGTLKALYATYRRIRKVYAARPAQQKLDILRTWHKASSATLAYLFLHDNEVCPYHGYLLDVERQAFKRMRLLQNELDKAEHYLNISKDIKNSFKPSHRMNARSFNEEHSYRFNTDGPRMRF